MLLVGLGFLNQHNEPTNEAKQALSSDLEYPSPDIIDRLLIIIIMVIDRTVIIFHNRQNSNYTGIS